MKGAVTFASFMVLGCFPLISYIPFVVKSYNEDNISFWISIVLTILCVISLGFTKGRFAKVPLTRNYKIMYTVQITIGCIFASAISYGMGVLLRKLNKEQSCK